MNSEAAVVYESDSGPRADSFLSVVWKDLSDPFRGVSRRPKSSFCSLAGRSRVYEDASSRSLNGRAGLAELPPLSNPFRMDSGGENEVLLRLSLRSKGLLPSALESPIRRRGRSSRSNRPPRDLTLYADLSLSSNRPDDGL